MQVTNWIKVRHFENKPAHSGVKTGKPFVDIIFVYVHSYTQLIKDLFLVKILTTVNVIQGCVLICFKVHFCYIAF